MVLESLVDCCHPSFGPGRTFHKNLFSLRRSSCCRDEPWWPCQKGTLRTLRWWWRWWWQWWWWQTGLSNGGGPIAIIAIIISPPWATQRITQILKNYDQTSRRSNSGSRRALEELKKRKTIKIWWPKWWSSRFRSSSGSIDTRGFILTSKIAK